MMTMERCLAGCPPLREAVKRSFIAAVLMVAAGGILYVVLGVSIWSAALLP